MFQVVAKFRREGKGRGDEKMTINDQSHTHMKTRLEKLRACLQKTGNQGDGRGDAQAQGQPKGLIVPRTDAFQGEYVAACDERLHWLTGFSGSAGYAIILDHRAAVFTDGRYTLQVREQVDPALYDFCDLAAEATADWLRTHAAQGTKLFYDPWLHPVNNLNKWRKKCAAFGGVLEPLTGPNMIDSLWVDRPSPPLGKMRLHDLVYAGIHAQEKCTHLAATLRTHEADVFVLSSPESICWLLNIRGSDIPCIPSLHVYGLFFAQNQRVELFLNPLKVSAEIKTALGENVTVCNVDDFLPRLESLTERVMIDPDQTPMAIYTALKNASVLFQVDPCIRPRAIKNMTEQAGARSAHQRDGVAVTRFLAWLDDALAAGETITELCVDEKLTAFRAQEALYEGLSFATIAGSGAHGAIVHYKATAQSNQPLPLNNLLLLDSGAQYRDGTTDITRTVAIGTPTAEHKDRFTRVLKGHIALAMAVFPVGTTGHQLDVLARYALWQAGLDYDHGTGHGVGSFLNVHEGPQRISKVANTVALEKGMIVSNEPGYYKTGMYGIRIESLVLVVDAPEILRGERPMLAFETLTMVPIDQRLIHFEMLTTAEKKWLHAYHQRVQIALEPHLNENEKRWLMRATAAK